MISDLQFEIAMCPALLLSHFSTECTVLVNNSIKMWNLWNWVFTLALREFRTSTKHIGNHVFQSKYLCFFIVTLHGLLLICQIPACEQASSPPFCTYCVNFNFFCAWQCTSSSNLTCLTYLFSA